MHPAHEIPTNEEELDRKSMTELSRIVHLYETHQISHREMNLMLDTLWACVSGLISEEWREMIEAARKVENDQAPWHLTLLKAANRTGGIGQFVRADRDEEVIDLRFYTGDGHLIKHNVLPYRDRDVPSVAVSQDFQKLLQHFTDKGYTTI